MRIGKKRGKVGKRAEAGGLRFGRESWAQAGIALRNAGREDGGPQVLRPREELDGAIAVSALGNAKAKTLTASHLQR